MLEIIPYIILILLIMALELTQIHCSRYKIRKWILPILSFLFSIYMMLFFISFELSDYLDAGEVSLKMIHIDTWLMFPVLNIPTVVFVLTNVIMKKLDKKNKIN